MASAATVPDRGQTPFLAARRFERTLLAIVVVAVVLRALLAIVLPQVPTSDAAYYVDRAREIAAGMGYQENGHPTAFWPAGYPVLLALTMLVAGPSLFGAMLLNLVATAVTVVTIAWFGASLLGDRRAGLIGAALYAVYPAHIAYSGAALTETVSTALVLGATALMLSAQGRARQLLLAGMVFGLATAMRAQMMYFPIGVAVAMAVLPRGATLRAALRSGTIVIAGLALVVLPLALRNQAVLGSFIPVSTNGGVALLTGASDDATGDHLDWDKARWDASGIPFEQRVERQVEADALFRAKAVVWIKANPGRWLALMPRKAMYLWIKDSDGFWSLKASYPQLEGPLTALQWINQLFYMAILALALPCLVTGVQGLIARDATRRMRLMLFLMPVFVTLTAIIFTGQIRYHYAAMPFLIVAAAWTIARLSERMTKPRRAAT